MGDVEIAVKERGGTQRHIKLCGHLRDEANEKRMREDAWLTAVKNQAEKGSGSDKQQERNNVPWPGYPQVRVHGLGQGGARRAYADHPIGDKPEHQTDAQDKVGRGFGIPIPLQKENADADDDNEGLEQSADSPCEGNEVAVVRHCFNESSSGESVKDVHAPGTE